MVVIPAAAAAVVAMQWRHQSRGEALVMVVMDPLAKQLACACVKGYAQRDYGPLADHLTRRVGRRVEVIYAEALEKALRGAGRGRFALVVGKQSVVKHDAQSAGLGIRPLCMLTGPDGSTTLTGLFVVKSSDIARNPGDLKDRQILFGPVESEEKHGAAFAALRAAGVTPPAKVQTRAGCSDAAMEVQDSADTPAPVAVISSYALPLLEGCGSIERGSLRVIGKTAPIPFVTVFATDVVSPELESRLASALSEVVKDAGLLKTLESQNGFVPVSESRTDWPDWRGPARDGQVHWLPGKLPGIAQVAWRQPLNAPGLGGIAAAEGAVVVGDRNALDQGDVFHCFGEQDGRQMWQLKYPTSGSIDYGPSPRATPVIHKGKVYLLSAFGLLHCVELSTGDLCWKTDLVADLGAKRPKWGYCSTPLVIDNKVIINPGAAQAAVVALDRNTGRVLWKTPGQPAAYASFISGVFGGKKQIVGYDAVSLGGWDVESGKRLWKLSPPLSGDFNVPTPVSVSGKLLVATENNGTRLYRFKQDGTIVPEPIAENSALAPDASTPVVSGEQVIGCSSALVGLDVSTLKVAWTVEDDAFTDFTSLIASGGNVLAMTFRGELWLLRPSRNNAGVVSRLRLLDGESEVYAHPALSGHRLFLRDREAINCVELEGKGESELVSGNR